MMNVFQYKNNNSKIHFVRIFLLLWSYFLCMSSAHAITIINKNKYAISYVIYEGYTCLLMQTQGSLSSNGVLEWNPDSFMTPGRLCVTAKGKTSTTGETVHNILNEGCVLTVVDAGFMRGIKINKGSGC